MALPVDAMLWRSREPQEFNDNGKPKGKVDEVRDFFKEHIN